MFLILENQRGTLNARVIVLDSLMGFIPLFVAISMHELKSNWEMTKTERNPLSFPFVFNARERINNVYS